jgi:hypothetical protein
MKRKINPTTMLMILNLQKIFSVYIDASVYAMGSILMQGGMVICYHSKVFHGGVLNYPTYDKWIYYFGTSCQKVESLFYGKGDHHPHKSLSTTIFVGP